MLAGSTSWLSQAHPSPSFHQWCISLAKSGPCQLSCDLVGVVVQPSLHPVLALVFTCASICCGLILPSSFPDPVHSCANECCSPTLSNLLPVQLSRSPAGAVLSIGVPKVPLQGPPQPHILYVLSGATTQTDMTDPKLALTCEYCGSV